MKPHQVADDCEPISPIGHYLMQFPFEEINTHIMDGLCEQHARDHVTIFLIRRG